MTAPALTGYAFLGFTCAHRVTTGAVVYDDHEWREVSDVLDERLHAGAPIITLATGDTFMHVRPSARLLICAHKTPDPCERHQTPQPLASLPAGPPSPAASEGER
ncbi:hypothetical protein JHN63_20275 [Streptomyces sp. MBT65]|uniref:hypothetical protein n=1 Tax=Streptomyces sp. MBT65 TaxID=1488395 RepID=UPI00190A32AF|nr:hypothetical protein [Streptomyces sp. MBT65]MBK3576112.1 hypothetical protein [Streptomyces sp. MBT65]